MRRRLILLILVVGLGFIVARTRRAILVPEPDRVGLQPWLEPVNGECPPTHPLKAKMSSGIYHVPGGRMYERTRPDRWYRDAAAAEADGLRPAKR